MIDRAPSAPVLTAAPHGAEVHKRWRPEQFYWAVLEVPPGVKPMNGGGVPAGLLAELADQIPVSLDELHAACVVTDDVDRSRLLVCAAERSELAALPGHTVTLRPAQLPDGLNMASSLAASLNLLTGDFEPVAQRRQRARRHWVGIAVVTLGAALVVTGLARRTQHWTSVASEARASAARALGAALPPGAPPEALPAEVARLQQASIAAAKVTLPEDAAVALASLLHHWPSGTPGTTPQSISVNESGITVSVLIERDPSEFLRAFARSTPPGWTMLEPRLNAGAEVTRTVIDLRPVADPNVRTLQSGENAGRGTR